MGVETNNNKYLEDLKNKIKEKKQEKAERLTPESTEVSSEGKDVRKLDDEYLKSLTAVLSNPKSPLDPQIKREITRLTTNIVQRLDGFLLKKASEKDIKKYEENAMATITEFVKELKDVVKLGKSGSEFVPIFGRLVDDFLLKNHDEAKIPVISKKETSVSPLAEQLKTLPHSTVGEVQQSVNTINETFQAKKNYAEMTVDAMKIVYDSEPMKKIAEQLKGLEGNNNWLRFNIGVEGNTLTLDSEMLKNIQGHGQENIFTNKADLLKALIVPGKTRQDIYEKRQTDAIKDVVFSTLGLVGALMPRIFKVEVADPRLANALNAGGVALSALLLLGSQVTINKLTTYVATREGYDLLKSYTDALAGNDATKIAKIENVLRYQIYERDQEVTGTYKTQLDKQYSDSKIGETQEVKDYVEYQKALKAVTDHIKETESTPMDYNTWKQGMDGLTKTLTDKQKALSAHGITVKGLSDRDLSAIWQGIELSRNGDKNLKAVENFAQEVVDDSKLVRPEVQKEMGKVLKGGVEIPGYAESLQSMRDLMGKSIGEVLGTDKKSMLLTIIQDLYKTDSSKLPESEKKLPSKTGVTTSSANSNDVINLPPVSQLQATLIGESNSYNIGGVFEEAFVKFPLDQVDTFITTLTEKLKAHQDPTLKALGANLTNQLTVYKGLLKNVKENTQIKSTLTAVGEKLEKGEVPTISQEMITYYLGDKNITKERMTAIQGALDVAFPKIGKTFTEQQRVDVLSALELVFRDAATDKTQFEARVKNLKELASNTYGLNFSTRYQEVADIGVEALFSPAEEKTLAGEKNEIRKQKKELAEKLTGIYTNSKFPLLKAQVPGFQVNMTTFFPKGGATRGAKETSQAFLVKLKTGYETATRKAEIFGKVLGAYGNKKTAIELYKDLTEKQSSADAQAYSPVPLITSGALKSTVKPELLKMGSEKEVLDAINGLLSLLPSRTPDQVIMDAKTNKIENKSNTPNTLVEKYITTLRRMYPQDKNAQWNETAFKDITNVEALKNNKAVYSQLLAKFASLVTPEDIFSAFQDGMVQEQSKDTRFRNLRFNERTGEFDYVDGTRTKTLNQLFNVNQIQSGHTLLKLPITKHIGGKEVTFTFDVKTNCINLNIPDDILQTLVDLPKWKGEFVQKMNQKVEVPGITPLTSTIQAKSDLDKGQYSYLVRERAGDLRMLGLLTWLIPGFVVPPVVKVPGEKAVPVTVEEDKVNKKTESKKIMADVKKSPEGTAETVEGQDQTTTGGGKPTTATGGQAGGEYIGDFFQ